MRTGWLNRRKTSHGKGKEGNEKETGSPNWTELGWSGLKLDNQNLMKAINSRIIPIAGYLMNARNLGKGDLRIGQDNEKRTAEREIPWKTTKWWEFYAKRKEGVIGLKSFKEVYDETKTRTVYQQKNSELRHGKIKFTRNRHRWK